MFLVCRRIATEFGEAVVGRSGIGRELVIHPVGLAEMVGAAYAGLLPELAHDSLARVLVGVDAALGHLPFEAGQNDFGPVVPESAADQHLAGAVEQGDPHIGAVGFVGHDTFE